MPQSELPPGTQRNLVTGQIEQKNITMFDFNKQEQLNSIVRRGLNPGHTSLKSGPVAYVLTEMFTPNNAFELPLYLSSGTSILNNAYKAKNLAIGGGIGFSIDAGVQLFSGDEFNAAKSFNSTVTTALTFGQALPHSLVTNAVGAYATARYNGDNAYASAVGSIAGTYLGAKGGDFILNNRFINKQVNSLTVASLINGNFPFADVVSSSMEPIAATSGNYIQTITNNYIGDGIGKIDYLNNGQ